MIMEDQKRVISRRDQISSLRLEAWMLGNPRHSIIINYCNQESGFTCKTVSTVKGSLSYYVYQMNSFYNFEDTLM